LSGGAKGVLSHRRKEIMASKVGDTAAFANRQIRDFATRGAAPDEEWEFFCECGCFELVKTTLAEFDAGHGIYLPGHRRRPARRKPVPLA
jgi:hypothetical protein